MSTAVHTFIAVAAAAGGDQQRLLHAVPRPRLLWVQELVLVKVVVKVVEVVDFLPGRAAGCALPKPRVLGMQ